MVRPSKHKKSPSSLWFWMMTGNFVLSCNFFKYVFLYPQVILQIYNWIIRLTAFLLCELNLIILSQLYRVVINPTHKHIEVFSWKLNFKLFIILVFFWTERALPSMFRLSLTPDYPSQIRITVQLLCSNKAGISWLCFILRSRFLIQ